MDNNYINSIIITYGNVDRLTHIIKNPSALCYCRIYERVVEVPYMNIPEDASVWLGQRNAAHGFFKVSAASWPLLICPALIHTVNSGILTQHLLVVFIFIIFS